MAHQVDLGQCIFHDSSSQIQLRFAATACLDPQLNQLGKAEPVDISQWLSSFAAWVVEAPELEIRLTVNVELGLESAATAFVSSLGERLCSSTIWTSLGIAMIFKSCDSAGSNATTGSYCLTFGLYREHTLLPATSRGLPEVMKNPPEPHAPMGIPTAALGALDISLEYDLAEKMHRREPQAFALKKPRGQFMHHSPFHYPEESHQPTPPKIHSCRDEEKSWLFPLDAPALDPSSDSGVSHLFPTQSMLRLFDFALQHLVFSYATKSPQINILGDNELQSLSKLAPAIFSPGYRAAMSQRAVSISIITRALVSMLEKNPSPLLKEKISVLQQKSCEVQNHGSSPDSNPNGLKSIIQSSLWRIAQTQLRREKPKKPASILFLNSPNEQLNLDEDPIPQSAMNHDCAFEDDDLDSYIGSDYNIPVHKPDIKCSQLLDLDDAMLLSTSSDSSFRDISESTQTTVDLKPPFCDPVLCYDSDAEMLFGDCDLIKW